MTLYAIYVSEILVHYYKKAYICTEIAAYLQCAQGPRSMPTHDANYSKTLIFT